MNIIRKTRDMTETLDWLQAVLVVCQEARLSLLEASDALRRGVRTRHSVLMLEESYLMDAAANGDDFAKAAIVERYQSRILAALKDRPNPERIAERVFARVFKFAGQFDHERAELGAWIFWLVNSYSRRTTP